MIRKKILNMLTRSNDSLMNAETEELPHETLFFNKKLFIHIPKTAGTSFRNALDEFSLVCRDYGKESPVTSDLIQEKIYLGKDHFRAYERFVTSEYEWLCGHFSLQKYLNWFSIRNIFVFVRDPIEQIVSHYNHHVSIGNYKGSFASFCEKPFAQNIHSKSMAGVPIELIGFVGITEKSSDSMKMLNHQLNSIYTEKKSNINSEKTVYVEELSKEEYVSLVLLLSQDIEFYKKVTQMFDERKKIEVAGFEWCHCVANLNENFVLSGCAFYNQSNDIVEIDIVKSGKLLKTVSANEFYAHYPKAIFPRKRLIGFRVPLSKYINKDDKIELVVRSTQQKINLC